MNAQKLKDSEVPSAVKEAQEQLYPKIKVSKWEKEENLYEASFLVNKIETSTVYDPAGALMATETEIAPSELPANVTHYVKRVLGGKKITDASKILDATGSLSYEAEVEGIDYLFDSNGTFVKKEEDKQKDDDKK
jgi:hypothetical protein